MLAASERPLVAGGCATGSWPSATLTDITDQITDGVGNC
jgi:hypothetical protein